MDFLGFQISLIEKGTFVGTSPPALSPSLEILQFYDYLCFLKLRHFLHFFLGGYSCSCLTFKLASFNFPASNSVLSYCSEFSYNISSLNNKHIPANLIKLSQNIISSTASTAASSTTTNLVLKFHLMFEACSIKTLRLLLIDQLLFYSFMMTGFLKMKV